MRGGCKVFSRFFACSGLILMPIAQGIPEEREIDWNAHVLRYNHDRSRELTQSSIANYGSALSLFNQVYADNDHNEFRSVSYLPGGA